MKVHVPAGFERMGGRIRVQCWCGYLSRWSSTRAQAYSALISEHESSYAVCLLCHRDRGTMLDGSGQWRDLMVVTSRDTGDQALVCATDEQTCQRLAQSNIHLRQSTVEAFGLFLRGPTLRTVEDVELPDLLS